MVSKFQNTLNIIREKADNDKDLGTAFEKLAKVFFENDSTQVQQYSKVWLYPDWAKNQPNYSSKDIGIDLVAKLRESDGYCAIQCKCYQSDHSISKSDLDSFVSASSTSDFSRLILLDTSRQPLGKNAKSVFNNLEKEYIRIQTSELEESRIDWTSYINDGHVTLRPQKELRDHQIKALNAVKNGLKEKDRGKLIMACGTGKTFTSLRIAEDLAGAGKTVLYMVPSLALMSQTIREWKNDAIDEFIAFSACSDEKVGKRNSSDDRIEVSLNDLAFPATTNSKKLSEQVKKATNSKMIVVFSTYQSIEVISKAQSEYDLKDFDLIICDEAHRTTGATIVGEDESNFIKIHDNNQIKGQKRIYMTATPRIFGDLAKKKADQGEVNLATMDDENTYGKTLFYRGFGWAVENNLLTDYKVVVLMMDEQQVSNRTQNSLSDGAELKLDDVTKMVGCYKALAKIGINNSEIEKDKTPMKSALAFCQNIKSSQMFSGEFSKVIDEYLSNEENPDEDENTLKVELFHVDGTFNAEQRNEKLNWLKEKTDKDICRVLTNARCLSEGVDVPALDAIMFLHPRKSQIDVVQSVGRVMRKSENKKLGYVILPITVAPDVSAEKALNDNKRYQVVWQILNALRAHDERFDSTINKIGLGEDISDKIEIIDGTSSSELKATTTVVENVRSKKRDSDSTKNEIGEETNNNIKQEETQQLTFTLTELSQAIRAKIVEKCGTRDYWENWANDIADIAQKHISRINSIVLQSGSPEREAFENFMEEIRDDLNPEITENDAVEMLAQHIITRPIFDTLFEGNRFTSENAVSKAIETILSKIYERKIDTESRTLEKFYKSVSNRASDIITLKGRQTLIYELYERFFKKAFPLMTKRLGIVYTPIIVVDFIIQSIEDLLKQEFGSSLNDENVHILDPFTGTGTFISRLLQSGILKKEEIHRKYKSEIHANEIILLAYYIACINIESVYEDITKNKKYESFNGIVLTDTFQLYEQERDLIANMLPDNSERRTRQKNTKIKIFMGNPPYSVGQSSANDNAANIKYKNLDKQIEETYVKNTKTTSKKDLYDSYIKAFRWASDRLSDEGIIGFISGSGWIDKNFAEGVRNCFSKEFNKIFIVNLRGDIRKNMLSKNAAGEGENIFGEGSMTGIAITFLVKNSVSRDNKIYYYDIGNNKSKTEKLDALYNFKSVLKIKNLQKIEPDEEHNWINKGDKRFKQFLKLGTKTSSDEKTIFKDYSLGINTNRDLWSYNFSPKKLKFNIEKLIQTYNENLKKNTPWSEVTRDPKLIKWSSSLESHYKKRKYISLENENFVDTLYRPFIKQKLYFGKDLIHRMGRMKRLYKDHNSKNLTIVINGIGSRNGLSCLMSNLIVDINLVDAGAQCFPLFLYNSENDSGTIFSLLREERESAINADIINEFESKLNTSQIKEEDIFYYIYGILHSKVFKKEFENDLMRSMPRIPIVKTLEEFDQYKNAGKKLGDMHINFETQPKYPVLISQKEIFTNENNDPINFYAVNKMKFDKKDKSTIIYNKHITIKNIPLEAYEYIINGRSAIEWVMDRACIKNDANSGIENNINDYANEIEKNPAYPLNLLQSIITLSIETNKIIKTLPKSLNY